MSKSKEIEDLKEAVADLRAQNEKLNAALTESSATRVKEKARELSAKIGSLTSSPAAKELGETVKPYVIKGVKKSKATAAVAREKFVKDVVPAAASALATALDVVSEKSQQVRKEVEKAAAAPEPAPKKKGKGWIGVVIGLSAVAALAAVAYSAYTSTDEHWIALDNDSEESV